MGSSVHDGDLVVQGNIAARTMTFPAGEIENVDVNAAAGIEARKLEHQYSLNHYQTTGTAIVAAVQDLHIAWGATGDIISVEAAITGALASDSSRHVYVDLHKSTAAGAFATVLSAPIDLSTSSVLRTLQAATISSVGTVDGDILRIVITVAGGAGTQAQGLIARVIYREDAN